jgi:cytoskeletal protein CcmA (bactofilin family)
MASIIKLKRSLTPGSIPGSLEAGELAINIPDKKLFSSNGSSVFNVSGDQYNLASASHDLGADIILTVDNVSLSNDAITLIGGSGIDITRNANGTISIAKDAADTVLGTDTSGNYVATIAAGPDIDVSGSGTETAAVTVGLAATISANTTGSAAKLGTARTIALTGDVVGSVSFDGSANASISTTIQPDSVALGTDTTGNYAAAVTGTAGEIEVSGSAGEGTTFQVGLPDNVTVGNNLTVSGNTNISGNLTLDGNLDVNGTLTYIDSTTVTIGDNMLKLANTNNADSIDTGFYSLYNSSGNKYTGLVRDATDGSYYLFDNLTTEPGQTINFGSVNTATLNAVIDGGTF